MPTVLQQYILYLVLNLYAVLIISNKQQLKINCFHYDLTFKYHNILLFMLEM